MEQNLCIVYVCSPDFAADVRTSLWSLYSSRTVFDEVVIFCTGKPPKSLLQSGDSRVSVRQVPSVRSDYWLANKTYVCSIQDKNVLFLDADVLVVRPINEILQGVDADVYARPSSEYYNLGTRRKWENMLKTFNINSRLPCLNAGMFFLRKGTHSCIASKWSGHIEKILQMPRNPMGWPRSAEQQALSLAVADLNLTFEAMNEKQHAFGWDGENWHDTCCYHVGSPNFFYYARSFIRQSDEQRLKQACTVKLPHLTYQHYKRRIIRKIQRYFQ